MYTKQEIIEEIREALKNPETFYNESCINRTGITSDTKEHYTEIVAEVLLSEENIKQLKKIPEITRESSYKINSHDGTTDAEASNRIEERIAHGMYGKTFDHIGTVIDYQVPLKNKRNDKGVGKIDLLAQKDSQLIILELKELNSKDTLLRCILEAYTYLKTVNKGKLCNDFEVPKSKVSAAAFIFQGSLPYEEYTRNENSSVRKLMDALKIGLYSISGETAEYTVHKDCVYSI